MDSLKKRYNEVLARIKAGEEHYSDGHMDEHFDKFVALIREANELLLVIPHTKSEILEGFDD